MKPELHSRTKPTGAADTAMSPSGRWRRDRVGTERSPRRPESMSQSGDTLRLYQATCLVGLQIKTIIEARSELLNSSRDASGRLQLNRRRILFFFEIPAGRSARYSEQAK